MKIRIEKSRHNDDIIIESDFEGAQHHSFRVTKWSGKWRLWTYLGRFVADFKTPETAIASACKRITEGLNYKALSLSLTD